ncbi:MAG: HD-GYP domain-containing protein [Trueperaceae bacterium]
MSNPTLPQFACHNLPILIAEGDKAQQLVLKQWAESLGYCHLQLTDKAHEILEHVQTGRVELLIFDVDMPQADSFELLKSLRRLPKENHIPILVVAPDNNPHTKIKALESGASDVLYKPLDSTETRWRIHNLLLARQLYLDLYDQKEALEKNLLASQRQLEASHIEMLTRLAKTAEYRDDENDQHIWRVAKTSALLAHELKLSQEHSDLIMRAARLHDVGKIALPDGILFKPTPLSKAEFEVVKTHTTIGAQILSGGHSPHLKLAETIALTHHERWDGTGYPHGLKGEAIPIEGRILALADTFDVLTHDRSFRRAIRLEDAASEIKKERGKQFDPKVVDAFVNLLRRRKLPLSVG